MVRHMEETHQKGRSKLRISTKGRYAMRLMLDLALHDTGKPLSLRDISERQEISIKYMEQIVSLLTRAGLVRSVRGPQGGYYLAHAPETITAGQILRLTEGSLSPAPCLEAGDKCKRKCECAVYGLWKEVDDAISEVLDNTRLSDLLTRQKELTRADSTVFE